MDKVIKIERPHRIKYLDSATKANSTKYAYVHPSVVFETDDDGFEIIPHSRHIEGIELADEKQMYKNTLRICTYVKLLPESTRQLIEEERQIAYVHKKYVESFEGFKYRLNVKYTAFKNLAALQPLYSKAIEEDIKREFNYRNKEDDDPSSISVYLNVLRPKLRKAVDSDTNNVIFTLEENPELTG